MSKHKHEFNPPERYHCKWAWGQKGREQDPLVTYYICTQDLSVPSWNVGHFLRQCRTSAGLTQEQLAEQMHRSRSCISKLENNRLRIDIPTFHQWLECTGTIDLILIIK